MSSLTNHHLPRRALALTLGLLAALLLWGAFALPLLTAHFEPRLPWFLPDLDLPVIGGSLHGQIKRWLIEQGHIPVGPHHLMEIIARLWRGGDQLLAGALLTFSVIFPGLKIALGALLALLPRRAWTCALVATLQSVARWSMADVFIVSLVLVFFKAEGLGFRYEASPGIFAYGASALVAALAAALVARLHRPL